MVSILIAGMLAQAPVDYGKSVLPVLRANCFPCHSAANATSGLALDSNEALTHGGNRGPALKLILEAVHQTTELKMPPGRKLKPEQIAILEQWIAAGAPMPESMAKAKRKGADHWAFQPVQRPALPEVRDTAWIRNPIDRFILAGIESASLKPSPEAARRTLLRRVSLDITGLPPTNAEIAAFLADEHLDAYERAVDRLLASPHYGERQARHWLDLARYSDTDGYTIDDVRQIWKYRDWVIDAYNQDQPFDRFTIEQLAGDKLPNPTKEQLIATGFHRNTPSNYEGGIDFEQYRVEAIADRVQTTSAVWMGLTVQCARCHDHKFDPVTQREYYQLFDFFNNADEVDKEADRDQFNKPFLELPTPLESAKLAAWDAQTKVLRAELDTYFKSVNSVKEDPGYKERSANLAALERRKPKITSTLIMRDRVTARETFVHIGGEFTRPGVKVTSGVPAVLPPIASNNSRLDLSRLDLAQWLVDRRNPLTARVTVNRLWQRLMGRGIVETENDFGLQGDRPTHPGLLDWLSTEFMDRGWSQKQLLRTIVTSAAYRQSSHLRAEDPENRLFARQSRIRLDAEAIRDAALVASNLLNPKIGGPSVYPPIPAGATKVTQVDRLWKTDTGPDRYRRGLYTFTQRSALHPGLAVFDAPDGVVTCTRRSRSNSPLQALTLLNDEAHVEFAQALARRLEKEGLDAGFESVTGRKPTAAEADRIQTFLNPNKNWAGVARALLNLDEFMTRE